MSEPSSPSRKIKNRLPREQRIAEISTVAREVFIECGYEKATVSEIARRLGIVEGTIFSHFGTKKDLMFHVIEQWYESQKGKVSEGLEGITGTDNRLRFVIWHHVTTIMENVDMCGVILLESRKPRQDMSAFLRKMNREYTAPLMSVLAEGIDSGEYINSVPAHIIRNMILGCVEHTMWDVLDHGRAVDIKEYSEQLTSMTLAAVKPAPSQSIDWENKFNELHKLVHKLAN